MSGRDVLIFLCGAAVGAVASFKICQIAIRKVCDEEIESVKEAYRKKNKMYDENCKIQEMFEEADKKAGEEEKVKYESVLKTSGYTAESKKTLYNKAVEAEEANDPDLPYVIKPECYGEYPKWGRRSLRFDKLPDGERLYDEDTNEDEDIRTVLGDDVLEHIDNYLEYEESSEKDCIGEAMVYVRDDIMHVDYAIDVHKYE